MKSITFRKNDSIEFIVFSFSIFSIVLSFIHPLLGSAFILISGLFFLGKVKQLSYLSIVFSSFHGVLQIKELSPIPGAIDVLFVVLLYVQLFMFVFIKREIDLKSNFEIIFVFLLLIVMTISVIFSRYNQDFIFVFLYIKDFFIPLMSFFYFYIFIKLGYINSRDSIRFLVLGLFVVSFLSLMHYFFDISDAFERYVPRRGLKGDDFASERVVMGISVARMSSLFALSTQGASSCLYAVGLYLTLFEKDFLKIKSYQSVICSLVFLACGIFSVSLSFVLTLVIIAITRVVMSNNPYIRLISVVIGALFIFLLSFFSVDDGHQVISLVNYAINGFIGPALELVVDMEFKDYIFGFGIIPKLYYNDYVTVEVHDFLSDVVYDNWVLGGFLQAGIPYLILSLIIIYICIKSSLSKFSSKSVLVSSLIIISFLGFSHGFFLLDRLFIFKSALLLAIVFNRKVLINV